MSRIRVASSRHGNVKRGRRNWKVIDSSGPEVFTRVFTFSAWWAAIRAADAIAHRQPVDPWGLMSVHTERGTSPTESGD